MSKNFIQTIKVFSVPVLIITMAGCGNLPKIPEPKLKPPGAPEVAQLKRVAVLPFEGKDGSTFSTRLKSMLVPFFEVVPETEAEGIFTGKVIESSVTQKSRTEERSTCDRKGLFKACKEGTKRTVNTQCTTKTATFEAIVFVAQTGKGEIYSRTVTGKDTDEYCKDSGPSSESNTAMLRNAQDQALQDIRHDVAAYKECDSWLCSVGQKLNFVK